MATRLVAREVVAERLGVSRTLLLQYEARGLIRAERDADCEGYPPAELRRVWSVLSLQRDAGINVAGVECVLRLRDQVNLLQRQLAAVAAELGALIEEDHDANAAGD
jgi:MerR family transcriptional regulator/heat shock protein HspR